MDPALVSTLIAIGGESVEYAELRPGESAAWGLSSSSLRAKKSRTQPASSTCLTVGSRVTPSPLLRN